MSDSGDAVIILSSDLIAEVIEEYFNKKMFKQSVKVVDLQANEAGSSFTIKFVKKELMINVPIDVMPSKVKIVDDPFLNTPKVVKEKKVKNG